MRYRVEFFVGDEILEKVWIDADDDDDALFKAAVCDARADWLGELGREPEFNVFADDDAAEARPSDHAAP